MSGKIVVVGASGYLGKPTVAALAKSFDPASIVVVTRSTETPAADEFRAAGVTVVKGGFADAESFQEVCIRWRAWSFDRVLDRARR